MDYDTVPVSPLQFIEDPYYVGQSFKDLAPKWKQEFCEIFAPGSQITTVIVTGAIGCGKTTFAKALLARKTYELSCLKKPAEFFGLLPGSQIVFGTFNVTLTKADDILEGLQGVFLNSPYFKEHCPLQERPAFPLSFPKKGLSLITGSMASHALGDNIFGFVLDEANFYKKTAKNESPNEKTRAHQLFNEANTRITSRFMRSGKTPGLVVLISSRKFQSSFLDSKIEEARTNPTVGKRTKVIECAHWEIRDPSEFSGKKFTVLKGTDRYPSRILEDDEALPEGGEIIEVPVEYLEQFQLDPDLALRDLAGVSTVGSTLFYSDPSAIRKCVSTTRLHPFTAPTISIPLGSGNRLRDFLTIRDLCHVESSQWVPIVNPSTPRFIHFDLAYSEENMGICMGHPFRKPSGQLSAYLDFMLRVSPPATGQLDLTSIPDFVKFLRELGFRIPLVTFDQFQSRVLMQLLVQAGFKAELVSVQLNHFNDTKSGFSQGLVDMYDYEPFMDETSHLLRDQAGGRPHHSTGEFDDVNDAVSSVVSQCFGVKDAPKSMSTSKRVFVPRPNAPRLLHMSSVTERFESGG